MNRTVMDRQMFKHGGAAGYHHMPDGSTMKDSDHQSMKYGGHVKKMQMGGEPTMAPPAGIAALEASPMPEDMGVGQVDPATAEAMISEASKDFSDPEQAQDFESMMNGVRGDDMSVEDRRAELAQIVGPEDAAATPESVLALVQPIVQMATVDQGIGGLAQEEMNQPVEGEMAGGIMSMMGA